MPPCATAHARTCERSHESSPINTIIIYSPIYSLQSKPPQWHMPQSQPAFPLVGNIHGALEVPWIGAHAGDVVRRGEQLQQAVLVPALPSRARCAAVLTAMLCYGAAAHVSLQRCWVVRWVGGGPTWAGMAGNQSVRVYMHVHVMRARWTGSSAIARHTHKPKAQTSPPFYSLQQTSRTVSGQCS